MKAFKGFVIKEFYHIFRDVRSMLILFGIPIAQVLLFGYIITTEIRDANIAILDHSNDQTTKEIIQKLASSGFFKVNAYLTNENQIQEVFKKGKALETVVFESNFNEKLQRNENPKIQIIADAADANTANLVVNYTKGIISNYAMEKMNGKKIPYSITPEIKMFYNPNMDGVYYFIPGIMAVILMLISALMTSVSIAREKETGTMEILLVSPLHPMQIVIGKLTPYFILSTINAISVITIGNLFFGVPITGSVVLLMLVSMLFITLALSLGLLISTAVETQQTAMFISMLGLMLPTMLLSGFIYPIENMPTWLQVICYIMPPKYYIEVIKGIMLKGIGVAYLYKQILILAAFTLFFLIVASKKFKIRL